MGDENKFKGRPRKIRSCKQMHNKYLIVCDVCKDSETINLLTTPHNLIASFRNNDLKHHTHPHERDCLNTTIYPVWTTYKLTVRCSDCRIINTASIQRMPETVKYEIETAVYSLKNAVKSTQMTTTLWPIVTYVPITDTRGLLQSGAKEYTPTPLHAKNVMSSMVYNAWDAVAYTWAKHHSS